MSAGVNVPDALPASIFRGSGLRVRTVGAGVGAGLDREASQVRQVLASTPGAVTRDYFLDQDLRALLRIRGNLWSNREGWW